MCFDELQLFATAKALSTANPSPHPPLEVSFSDRSNACSALTRMSL